ncbi:hypothetical protein EPN15_04545 [Patescibacteria group bacterium]|nr:MAG: hypothetical protein EPN15_04545 [Patescibacteria group bacterium]
MNPEVLTESGKVIFPLIGKFEDFYLAGGTALALQIGHRISVDFDLFSEKEIGKNLLAKVKRVFENKEIIPSVNNPDELTVFINGVKTTFLKYPFPVQNKFINYNGVKLLDAKEIASTKAYTISRSGTIKDYVDLYFILSEKISFLDEIMEMAKSKFGNEFNDRLFLEQLVYFNDIEEASIKFLKKSVSKKELEEFFKTEVGKIKI